MAAIIRRNREEFAAFNFANFMERLLADAMATWHSHLRERSFTFLEKRLRNVRIWALKIESFLFRAAHKLRGIKEKNGQNGGTNNGNSSSAESNLNN